MSVSNLRRPSWPAVLGFAALVCAVVVTSGVATKAASSPKPTLVYTELGSLTVQPGDAASDRVDCPSGTFAIGGSFSVVSGRIANVLGAGASKGGDGYFVLMEVPPRTLEAPTTAATVRFRGLCAKSRRPIVPGKQD